MKMSTKKKLKKYILHYNVIKTTEPNRSISRCYANRLVVHRYYPKNQSIRPLASPRHDATLRVVTGEGGGGVGVLSVRTVLIY